MSHVTLNTSRFLHHLHFVHSVLPLLGVLLGVGVLVLILVGVGVGVATVGRAFPVSGVRLVLALMDKHQRVQ